MKNNIYLWAVVIPITASLFIGVNTALADCGNIIYQDYNYDTDEPFEAQTEILDCNNPFNADEPAPFIYELELAEQNITPDVVISVTKDELVSVSYSIDKSGNFAFKPFNLFKQEGDNYREIVPSESEDGTGIQFTSLETGEYIAVLTYEAPPILTQAEPLWKRFLAKLFLPNIAQAFYDDYLEVVTIPFSVEHIVAEPAGASSVLFLPGIQASRLYLGDGNQVSDKLWEPSGNDDVATLALNQNGESIIDIRTNDIIEEAAIPIIGGNIYKGFSNFMDDMVEDDVINEWAPFAYDWRYDVFDIVENGTKYLSGEIKKPTDELIRLANNSKNGKVTIIAHSNGGLLAKAMMLALEEQGKADLVDKIVFIGTPHLGTPKAIATILHGYDQEKLGGLLIDDKVARETMSNMPGAYGLLPSEKYLNESSEPIINFSDGEATQFLIDEYGSVVSSFSDYTEFLKGKDGRDTEYENISFPYTTNELILDKAFEMHRDTLDNWAPPEGVEVHNIVGVGLKTIKAVEYRTVTETACPAGATLATYHLCTVETYLKPYAHFTQYGDETVTALSAESIYNDSYFFNILAYNRSLINPLFSNAHEDFTEIEEIQELINQIMADTEEDIDYVSTTPPVFNTQYTIKSIDSPISILVTDVDGNQTGIKDGEMIEEIPGSEYFEFGGTKYLIVPKDTEITTVLSGEDYGGYTLTIATLDVNGEQVTETKLINATTSPKMIATYSGNNGNFSNITTDLDGDGVFETETTLDGEVVNEKEEISYDTLREQIADLDLSKRREKVLLVMVNLSENFVNKISKHKIHGKIADKLLKQLSKTVDKYKKLKWISKQDADNLKITIKALRASIK